MAARVSRLLLVVPVNGSRRSRFRRRRSCQVDPIRILSLSTSSGAYTRNERMPRGAVLIRRKGNENGLLSLSEWESGLSQTHTGRKDNPFFAGERTMTNQD